MEKICEEEGHRMSFKKPLPFCEQSEGKPPSGRTPLAAEGSHYFWKVMLIIVLFIFVLARKPFAGTEFPSPTSLIVALF